MKRRSLLGSLASLVGITALSGCSTTNDIEIDSIDDSSDAATTTDDSESAGLPIVVDILNVEGNVERGQPTVEFAIGNRASESVYVPVEVFAEGNVVKESEPVIGAGEIKTFSATWFSDAEATQETGEVVVDAGGVTALERFPVQSRVYPEIENVVWVDEEHVEVTYSAVNEGSAMQSSSLELRTNQVPSEIKEVELGPGESETFTDEVRVWDGMVRLTVVTDFSMAKQLTSYCRDSS